MHAFIALVAMVYFTLDYGLVKKKKGKPVISSLRPRRKCDQLRVIQWAEDGTAPCGSAL